MSGGRRERSGGYALMEMLVALMLLAVAVGLAGRLIVKSVTLQGDVADAAWGQDRLNEALFALRADVWGAKSVVMGRPVMGDWMGGGTVWLVAEQGTGWRWELWRELAVDGVVEGPVLRRTWVADVASDVKRGGMVDSTADAERDETRIYRLPTSAWSGVLALYGTDEGLVGMSLGGSAWMFLSERARLDSVGLGLDGGGR